MSETHATPRRIGLVIVVAASLVGCGASDNRGRSEGASGVTLPPASTNSTVDSDPAVMDESVPPYLVRALNTAGATAATAFLERHPIVLPDADLLPLPASAGGADFKDDAGFGDGGYSTTVSYTRWPDPNTAITEAWFALSASYQAPPISTDSPYVTVKFGDSIAQISPDLTAACGPAPEDGRNPTALIWEQDGVQYLLQIRPVPECEKPFTWQDVRTIIAALLRCSTAAGSVRCEPADLPKLPETPPTN